VPNLFVLPPNAEPRCYFVNLLHFAHGRGKSGRFPVRLACSNSFFFSLPFVTLAPSCTRLPVINFLVAHLIPRVRWNLKATSFHPAAHLCFLLPSEVSPFALVTPATDPLRASLAPLCLGCRMTSPIPLFPPSPQEDAKEFPSSFPFHLRLMIFIQVAMAYRSTFLTIGNPIPPSNIQSPLLFPRHAAVTPFLFACPLRGSLSAILQYTPPLFAFCILSRFTRGFFASLIFLSSSGHLVWSYLLTGLAARRPFLGGGGTFRIYRGLGVSLAPWPPAPIAFVCDIRLFLPEVLLRGGNFSQVSVR